MSNPEQPRCINPKCKEPLFTPTANRCHKCFTIQQQLPEHQQTAPSGPGPPTASQLPSGSVDRQSGTHTDPSQYVHPPPSGPGTQYSGSQQGNRDGSGGVSGDTNKEQFFDAQPVLPQTARPYHHEGHPPSSQPNIPQRYQYPQVFGMPHQQQTAPSGPGPPTASQLPLGPEDRQSRTHTDPSQHVHPPPSGPGIQYSWSQEGKRYISGSESGDTNKEQFFDAQSVLPQSQTAMARPYDYRGPPPSSQPNVPQTYQYPQVFGMPPSRGPGSEGTPVPLFAPGGQVPYPPLPPGIQVPQGGHLAWLPSIQQFILIPHGYIGTEHPGFSPQASSQMVHGQISPQSMPYHQPHTSQPQSPGGMPLPQPPTSQSQAPSSVGMPYHQPHTSQPQSPSSTGIVSPQSHSSQPQLPSSTGHSSQSQPSSMSSPQLNTSHPPPETHPGQPSPSQSSLQPQSPTGSAPLHQQPTGAAPPRISTQSSQESGTTLPQGLETDSQMQVSTSVSPKPESFPPPSSHPSAASSIPATSVASTENFQATDPPKQREQDKHFSGHNGTSKGTNSGKVPDKGNNSEQSSTQVQPTNTQPKTATSFTDTSSHPLQGTSDSTKKSSEQGSDANNKGPRKRSTTDSDDSGRIPAKLAKQDDTKKENNKEPNNDKDAKGGTSEQLSEEPPKDKQPIQPENPVSQHAGDSQTGPSTSVAVTKEVSLVYILSSHVS